MDYINIILFSVKMLINQTFIVQATFQFKYMCLLFCLLD
jgi:hypothetical protein